MKWIIAVEETVTYRHRICVEVDNENQIQEALDNVDYRCRYLDDFASAVGEIAPVVWIDEDDQGETESLEYYDDYEDDEY